MSKQTWIAILNILIAVAGVALVFYGLWNVYRPAAFVVGGVLLILATISRERRLQQ
jgi:hypothetical protein